MNDVDIFIKTAAGVDEIHSRACKLPQRLRTMLIMIDGTQSVAQLKMAAARLAAPEDFLDNLVKLGLIEGARVSSKTPAPAATKAETSAPAPPTGRPEAARFAAAKKFMNDSAVDALGLRAFFFTLKLEKCFTLADLQALLPEYAKAIAKARGDDVGRTVQAQARDLMR